MSLYDSPWGMICRDLEYKDFWEKYLLLTLPKHSMCGITKHAPPQTEMSGFLPRFFFSYSSSPISILPSPSNTIPLLLQNMDFFLRSSTAAPGGVQQSFQPEHSERNSIHPVNKKKSISMWILPHLHAVTTGQRSKRPRMYKCCVLWW